MGLTGCENQRSSIPHPSGTSAGTLPVQLSPTGSDMTSVARTTIEFYEAVKRQNYMLAFSYLDTSAHTTDGQKLTPTIFKQLARTMDSQEGPVVNYSIAAFPPAVVMTITRKGMGPYHTHL